MNRYNLNTKSLTSTFRILLLCTILFFCHLGLHATNYYWTGSMSSEFQNPVNWVDASGIHPNTFPGINDNVFFDVAHSDTTKYRNIVSTVISVNSITCTADSSFILTIGTINVYGSINLNGNMLLRSNANTEARYFCVLNLLNPAGTIDPPFSDLSLGNRLHYLRVNIDRPGSGITLTSDFNITSIITIPEGSLTSNGYDITVQSFRVGNENKTAVKPRTITLANCTLTCTYSGSGFGSGNVNTNNFDVNNLTYNTSTCDVVISNPYNAFYSDLTFKSLTFKSNDDRFTQFRTRTGTKSLNVGTLRLETPNLDIGANTTFNITTLDLDTTTKINPTTTGTTFNVGTIDETDLSCNKTASMYNVSLNIGTNTTTQHISFFKSKLLGSHSLTTSKANDLSGNTGSIVWTAATGIDYYWAGGTGAWNDPSKWHVGSYSGVSNGCVPTLADNVFFDAATTPVVSMTANAFCNNISWTGSTESGSIGCGSGVNLTIAGNVDFSGCASIAPDLYFVNQSNTGNFSIFSGTSTTRKYTGNLYFYHLGTYTLTSDLYSSSIFYHYTGNLLFGGSITTKRNVDLLTIYSSSGLVRSLNLSYTNIRFLSNGFTASEVFSVVFNKAYLDINLTQSEFHIYAKEAQHDNNTLSLTGAFHFHNVYFHNIPGNSRVYKFGISSNQLTYFNKIVSDNTDVLFPANSDLSIDSLMLSPFRTYTFRTGRTITINKELISGTSDCQSIIFAGPTTGAKATIKNNTNHPLTVPGANLTGIAYTMSSTESTPSHLSASGGIDNDNNDLENIDIVAKVAKAYYWIGKGSATPYWHDGANWSLSDNGIASGCVPSIIDTVYFTTHSFSAQAQQVVMQNPVEFATLVCTDAAGSWKPVFKTNKITVSGFIRFAPGVVIDYEVNTAGVSFTGNSLLPDAQKFVTTGVTYASGFSWGALSSANGRYDLYGTFYIQSLLLGSVNTGNAGFDLYTHGSTIDCFSSFHIIQAVGRTVDVSNTKFAGYHWQGAFTINDSEKFNGDNSLIAANRATSYAFYNNTSDTIRFGVMQTLSGADLEIMGNGNVLLRRMTSINTTVRISHPSLTLDTLNMTVDRSHLKLPTLGKLTINKAFIVPGTPCDNIFIESLTANTQGYLHINKCDMELYFLIFKDVHVTLNDQCPSEAYLSVLGTNDGNNSGALKFSPAPSTNENTWDKLYVSCMPYTLKAPVNGNNFLSIKWSKNGTQLKDFNNKPQLSVSEAGIYTMNISYKLNCNSLISQEIAHSANFTWNGSAADSDWNNKNNWTPISIPDSCSYVVIPDNITTYPKILAPNPYLNIAQAACDIIEFQFGGEASGTQHLDYNKAKVQVSMNANNWHMFSPPLQGMFPGDIYKTSPNPVADNLYVYTMLFSQTNPETGGGSNLSGDWTGTFNTPDVPLSAGFGMAVWLDDTTPADQHDTHSLWLPKTDASYNYYDWGGNVIGTVPLNRQNENRFVYEQTLNEATGNITLQSNTGAASQGVIVGNPFMAHWNFNNFYNQNSADIANEYKILTGSNQASFTTYRPDVTNELSNLIPPMQSIIVTSRQAFNQLYTNVNATNTDPGNKLKSPRRNQNVAKQVLAITAHFDGTENKTHLVFDPSISYKTGFAFDEDSYKLFVPSVTHPVAVYTRSLDQYALDIQTIGTNAQLIPLGVRTSGTGQVRIEFSDATDFASDYDVFLYDAVTNAKVNIANQSSYEFTKDAGELFLDGRLFLSVEQKVTTSDKNNNATDDCFIYAHNKALSILSSTAIVNIQLIDIQGKFIFSKHNINQTTYTCNIDNPGAYVVRIVNEKGVYAKKIIIK